MKRSISSWSIDACFLAAMAWGLGWLFYIITGVYLFFGDIPLPDQLLTMGLILVVGVFPLLIGLLMSSIFTFISIKFHPSIDVYILVCALLVILPTIPFMKTTSAAMERSDDLQCLYIFYIALGILLSNFIYQRIKLISNATSSPS